MAYTVPKLEDYSPAALQDAVHELVAALDAEAALVISESDYKNFHDRWISRKSGILTQINDLWLKASPIEKKREVGQAVNEAKFRIQRAIVQDTRVRVDLIKATGGRKGLPGTSDLATLEGLRKKTVLDLLEAERIDVTLPGIHKSIGAEHPMLKTMNEVVGVFRAMGYSVADGPEIETDYFNFEALNFPPNHPARDTQDTLFVAGQEKKPQRDRLLLRTHTSPVQIRSMLKNPPPLRVVIPGKVHRADTADATHSPIFHQVEGLAVDTNITFSDLKGTLDHAMKSLFGSSVKTRFYPSFFPFTEPSADVQITCFKCGGKGCRLCKMSGWIELLGCGMVDPNVFKSVEHNGYDSQKIGGFAFGMGVERITMLKYGIDDIQLFYQGDVRFLEQFA
jgi:phenylalanyl-tRNA synthetase alpha chain